MVRQIIIGLIVACSLGAVGFFIYQLLQQESHNIDAVAMVPDETELLLTLERIHWWPGQGDYIHNQIKSRPEGTSTIWQQLHEWGGALYTLYETDDAWKKALENSNLAFAGTHALHADSWLFVFVLEGDALGPEDWLARLSSAPIKSRDFKGEKIYESDAFYCAKIGTGMITSKSVAQIEGSILAHQARKTLMHHDAFVQAYEVRSHDAPFHLFGAFNAKEWVQLEASPSTDGLAYLGLHLAQDSTAQTTVIHSTRQSAFPIPHWLPSTTTYWDAIAFESQEELLHQCEQFYANTPRADYWQAAWQIFGDSCACDINEALLTWRNGQCGVVAWDVNDSVSAEVYYFGSNDTNSIVQRMPNQLLKKLNVSAPLYQIQIPQLFDRNRISSIVVEPTYFLQLDAYVFLSHSLEDLQSLYAGYALHPLPPFLKAHQTTLDRTTRATYIGPQSAVTTLPMSLHQLLLSGTEHLITYQEASELRTMVSVYTSAPSSPVQDPIAPAIAAVDSLTTATLVNTWTVINHQTSAKERLEERKDHVLQLKDEGGKILWTYTLPSPVIGDVIQLDALKNGKLQMAFTTAKGLHVIDRNGQPYPPLCIPSTVAITSPLSVFDYESNKNYRLCFGLENGEVKNLSANGTPTPGWQYEKQGIVAQLVHFKQGTDDCILMIETDGHMHLHKRNGSARAEACQPVTSYSKDAEVIVGQQLNQSKLQWVDHTGRRQAQLLLKN